VESETNDASDDDDMQVEVEIEVVRTKRTYTKRTVVRPVFPTMNEVHEVDGDVAYLDGALTAKLVKVAPEYACRIVLTHIGSWTNIFPWNLCNSRRIWACKGSSSCSSRL
jgi:hypothetical protein